MVVKDYQPFPAGDSLANRIVAHWNDAIAQRQPDIKWITTMVLYSPYPVTAVIGFVPARGRRGHSLSAHSPWRVNRKA